MKKIKDVLSELPNDIFTKALTNITNNGEDIDEQTSMDVKAILTCMFPWHSSPEGSDYWINVTSTLTPTPKTGGGNR